VRIAVVGAGINGIMSAWALAEAGHSVVLFERGRAMAETSSASSKLLHGGLRYLETGDFALVREGLRERAWWLRTAPDFARRLELVVPVFRDSPRGRWMLKLGLLAYDLLAGRRRLGWHRWLPVDELRARNPDLQARDLLGGYLFFDGTMDDRALGLWALGRALALRVELREHTAVESVDVDGGVCVGGKREPFDYIVNVAGPWAHRLLELSKVPSEYRLDLVRGSHLLVRRESRHGFLLQSPDDGRVCFVLPFGGNSLIGTTEVRQTLDQPIACSDAEREYLVRLFNRYFSPKLRPEEIVDSFSGLRPLLADGAGTASKVSRESVVERNGRLVTVFGGKWTSSRVLGLRVAAALEAGQVTGQATGPARKPLTL
jgi:glycerol-3-phosphate dehydrogenase